MKVLNKEVIEIDVDDVQVEVQQSESSYQGIRSAISYIYKIAQVPMPEIMKGHLKNFLAGKRRTGLKEKQNLGLKIQEGKREMTLDVYEMIAKRLFF